jgi:hypothetical protein
MRFNRWVETRFSGLSAMRLNEWREPSGRSRQHRFTSACTSSTDAGE